MVEGGLIVAGSQTTPGTPGGSASGSGQSASGDWRPPITNPETNSPMCWNPATQSHDHVCLRPVDATGGLVAETASGVAPLTIADLAAFTPAAGSIVVEPDGWAVIGTPTNVYATAIQHVQSGTLLGAPVEVRWSPASFTFDYGDGVTAESETAGAPWSGSESGWTETSTSHVYSARGTVTVSATIAFTASVDLDGTWYDVPGELEVAVPGVAVEVFEVDTVLTDDDCVASPAGAGCH